MDFYRNYTLSRHVRLSRPRRGALTQLPHRLGLPFEICGLGHSFLRAARVYTALRYPKA
jgi:hypothetical protein